MSYLFAKIKTIACRITPNFFMTYNSLIKIIYSLRPIMCTISIPFSGPHDAHHNCTLERELSQKLRGLDKKKCAMHGAPVVATSAVSIPPIHGLKLSLDVPGLPFLSRHGKYIFKLSADVLLWFH